MSFIALRFTSEEADVVAAIDGAKLPVRGPSGRFYVLHGDGTVTQHPTAPQATFALSQGGELLMWWVGGNAVACSVDKQDTRIHCRLDLAGASEEEARATAAAVNVLLSLLRDVEIEARL